MRHITTVIKGNFRKSKGAYIGIFLLMFIVSAAVCSVVTYYSNANTHDAQMLHRDGFGDMIDALYSDTKLEENGMTAEAVVEDIRACKAVEKVSASPVVYTNMMDCHGKKATSTVFILSENDKNLQYKCYDDRKNVVDKTLKKGEIRVPVSFLSLYDCKIGDTLQLGSSDETYSFKVASYLEDPCMGTSMMGIKTLLVSDEDFAEMKNVQERYRQKYEGKEDAPIPAYQSSMFLNIFADKQAKLTEVEFEKELNRTQYYSQASWITLTKERSVSYMMMLTDVFSAVLIIFAAMLLIATLIVLSHNISSSIEIDYTNIGILKAVGMTNGNLRTAMIIGYLGTTAAGLVCGILAAVPIVKIINKIILPSSGLYVSDQLAMSKIAVILCLILLFVSLFVACKTLRLSKVTPLKAIQAGTDGVRFSSILQLPISGKFLNISLAYRQFIAEKKQYIAAIVVTAIITLFMAMVTDVYVWMNQDAAIDDVFSVTKYDLSAGYKDETVQAEAEKVIAKHSSYEKYQLSSVYLMLNDLQVYCNIADQPEEFCTVREGRTCLYDNEILITQYIADGFGVDIGDEMKVKKEGMEETYIISGIYESSSDTGKNFAMSYEGLQRILPEEKKDNHQWGRFCYKLKDAKVCDAIMKEVEQMFEKDIDYSMKSAKQESEDSGVDVFAVAVSGLTALIYIVGAVFVVVTESIVSGKIIFREKREYGIYKSIGFTSLQIRMQLVARFIVTALLGCVIGIVLAILAGDAFLGATFEQFGIYSYEFSLTAANMSIPVIFMIVVFAISAFVKARKVKRVDPGILMNE